MCSHPTGILRIIAGFIVTASLAACGGGGGGGGNTPTSVVVSGKVTFDRIPFKTTLGRGLDVNAPVASPARQIVVEALNASSQLVATTVTDTAGNFSMSVPPQTTLFLRAKAQMLKQGTAPIWDFSVRNNTNSDALYVLDGSTFDTGQQNSTHDLHAASGWGGSSYTGTRAAAPFAILDTVYRAKELILASAASSSFPALSLFWSSSNRPAVSNDPTVDPFCPDQGNIVTSSYRVFPPAPDNLDGCGQPGAEGIYILGDVASGDSDTDEFDQHVIAHEFGHYIEDRFSRSDSIGGSHSGNDRLDLRVAFSEGWGNAYSAMTLNDPVYRDSFAVAGSDFGFNLESDAGPGDGTPEGWFGEFSVGEILWDIFDGGSESGDTVALGFGPIYSVMIGAQVQTDALTSIFSFAEGIRAANPAAAASISALLSGEDIHGSDAFAQGETNSGGDNVLLPLYPELLLNSPVNVCSRSLAGGNAAANKLGNRRFFRFNNNQARAVTIRAIGAAAAPPSVAATDPDIFVHRAGQLVEVGVSDNNDGNEVISQVPLVAGTYVIEFYDFDVAGASNVAPRCMNVSIEGA